MTTTAPRPTTTAALHPDSGGHEWRLGRFPELMPRRIERILLVSSAYDAFILEEDGLLTEMIYSEYVDLGLSQAPQVRRAASGEAALKALRSERFDLVITMLRLGDMDIVQFTGAARAAAPHLPLVLLIANELELARMGSQRDEVDVDSMYVWQGDARLFLAIIKVLEDLWNAEHDTRVGGVGVIILVEDSVRHRSSMLPLLYTVVVEQTRRVMQDGINRMHRQLRLRARPKLLVAESYEEATRLYERYREHIVGVVTDVRYPRGGALDAQAGIALIRKIKAENPDVPALLQSSDPENRALADSMHTAFLHKRSRTLLHDIREFMLANFGFGDFVFRLPDGREVARAADLPSMVRVMKNVPAESLEYHAARNHFSNWLRARTEFGLARQLRPLTLAEFPDIESLRAFLILALGEAQRLNRRGAIEDFSREHFDPGTSFARVGGGSLGGKARGLAFLDALLARKRIDRDLSRVRVFVPRSVVIGTDVFDRFLAHNQLRTNALYNARDEWIRAAFLKSELPEPIVEDLRVFLARVRSPLAVRSSSLLEDSPYHPFAGVYDTHMLPNNHQDDGTRLDQLCDAIKLVYASSFYAGTRKYLESTPHRIEEQKMAVILQQIVGTRHGDYFYPDFAGSVRSYNFYPFGRMRPEDGVASVALGLGQEVMGGGDSLRFSPRHPHILPQMDAGGGKNFIDQSQRTFLALDLSRSESGCVSVDKPPIVELDLDAAEEHGVLANLGSVWSPENECFYDGIHRPGVRLVTFAHVLKAGVFPLAELLCRALEIGREGMSGPVELEFACNLGAKPREFAILQIRPFTAHLHHDRVEIDLTDRARVLCYCEQALGNGVVEGIADIVYVKPDSFDPTHTTEIAQHISRINDALTSEHRPCVLIGPGRWGSTNRWLGVPITWAHISAARVIVEACLESFKVDPSQGSHFFHNLTSLGVAYLTINPAVDDGFVDWEWLAQRPAKAETPLVRHVRLEAPLEARIDGRSSRAAIFKRGTVKPQHDDASDA